MVHVGKGGTHEATAPADVVKLEHLNSGWNRGLNTNVVANGTVEGLRQRRIPGFRDASGRVSA